MSCEVSNGKCRCPDDATVISSFATPISKFICPILVTVLFGGMTLSSIAKNEEGWLVLLVAWIVLSLMMYWGGICLKWVAFDDENIYISNYLKMISVPLADIERVKQHFFVSTYPVSITFGHETDFGRKIFLMPKFYPGSIFFMSHPFVEDLRSLVEERKKEGN